MSNRTRYIEQGERLRSISGRPLAPVPRIDTHSDRCAHNTLRRIDGWLLAEAKAEAHATHSDFLEAVLSGLEPKAMSPSDRDTLNYILFGDIDGPRDESRSAS